MFGNNKPFGTASAFGGGTFGNTTTPFGQPAATTFGAKPATGNVFGASTFGTAPPASGGLFGNTAPTASTGLFGQTPTAFGQPASTSGGSFAFGTGTSTSTGLFGATAPATQSSGLFGGSSTSAFGTPRPTFGGFGAPATGTGLFGQNTTAGTGLFGTSTGFAATAPVGTTVKFLPPTGTDTMMKGGVTQNISTRHQCITCMKEYENKSLEELRLEDYMANRKGPQAGAVISGFGTPAPQAGLFGAPAASTSGFSFGTTQAKPLFGTTTGTNTFGGTTPGLFGQPAQQQNTGIFGKSVAFGTTTTAAPTFAFGNTAGTTSLFGQNNQQKPLFGQPTTGTGLFGQPAAAQPAASFGTGFNTFGATTQPTMGLFGNKTTGAATTNTFTFGNATTTGGLFGQKSAAPTFGTNTAFGTGNTFGSFGTTQTTNTGLFGQPKAGTTGFGATGTGFGTGINTGFGASPFTSMGMNTSTGTGLFGSTLTTNKPGFNFTGAGGFGQPTGIGTGFNFNATPTPAVGSDAHAANALQQQLLAQQVFAFNANPFGDNPLFRNSIKDPKRREEILKPTNPAAQKAVLTNNQFKVSPFPSTKIKPKPLTPLSSGKVSLFDGLEDEEPSLSNTTFVPKRSVKKLVLKSQGNTSFTVRSNISSDRPSEISFSTSILLQKSPMKDVGRGDTPQSLPLTVSVSESSRCSVPPVQSPDPVGTLPINLLSSESSGEKSGTVAKLSLDHSLNDTIQALHTKPKILPYCSSTSTMSGRFQATPSDSESLHKDYDSLLSSPSIASESVSQLSISNDNDPAEAHKTGIRLNGSGYYTKPILDELSLLMDQNGNCLIDNFVVGREGYGKVRFLGLTNVANLNLDEIVCFRRKEITVYPDDEDKPPIGEGLNKNAEVTLECVWPMDKTTHEPIKDPVRLSLMGYREKIEKTTARLGAKFIDYKPETGSWIFQVEHFSKYGLEDSDDECDDSKLMNNNIGASEATKVKKLQMSKEQNAASSNETQQPKKLRTTAVNDEDDDDDEMQDTDSIAPNEDIFFPLQQLVTAGMDSERIQGMKASFFLDEVEDNWVDSDVDIQEPIACFGSMKAVGQFPKPVPVKRNASNIYGKQSFGYLDEPKTTSVLSSTMASYGSRASKSLYTSTVEKEEIWSAYPLISTMTIAQTPVISISKKFSSAGRKISLKPLSDSLMAEKQRYLTDMGYFMGRRFRIGWAPNLKFLHLGQVQGYSPTNNDDKDCSVFSALPVQRMGDTHVYRSFHMTMSRVQVLGDVEVDDVVKNNLVQSLKVQLQHSKSLLEDGTPVFVPKPGIDSLHAHASLSEEQFLDIDPSHSDSLFIKQRNDVWELCVALWGEIPGLESDKTISAYAQQMARRESLSSWLIKTTKDRATNEINNKHNSCHLSTIFSHLTRREISKAVLLSQEANDHCLATLLAQAEGNAVVRKLISKQLMDWEQCKAYRHINHQRLKLYALLAGLMVWSTADLTINCCENLDWRRTLAIHLWYHCLPTASIRDAVLQFESNFSNPDEHSRIANAPVPPYLLYDIAEDIDESQQVYDTCFHLLKLYCDRSYRLDRLLMPVSSTPTHTDCRLSWFLHQALSAIGYCHLPQESASSLHLDFAAQLEAMGLWHWSIFIVLHFPNTETREKCVKDILLRHLSLDRNEESAVDQETFLQEKLLVPAQWIFQAKAIKARSFGQPANEAWYLLKAGCWSQSHDIVISQLASDAIINENYEFLLNFLNELAPPERSETILDWASGGQVFLDYIHVSQMVDSVVRGDVSAYDVEKLQPEVVSLCHRLSDIQCRSAKDRLCQSEMAKKTATLLRAVFTLQAARSGNPDCTYTLTPHIKSLPMPEDYALQELRAVARSFLTAVQTE